MYYPGEDDEDGADEDFVIVWDGTQTVTYEELAEEGDSFLLAFRLHDIYGEYTDSSLTGISIQ